MWLAFVQSAADTSSKSTGPVGTTPRVGIGNAASDLVNDPANTVGHWMDVAGRMIIEHGPRVLGALVLLVLAYVAAKWLRRIVIKGCLRAHIDITLAKFLGNLVNWSVIIFALVSAAGTVGISTAGFAAMIGAAGLAIGLALQGNLGNLAAGVLLMIFRPFKIGDSVIVAGQTGIIDGIDLFTTNVDTGDNRRVIVPNSAIFGGVIENQSHHPRRRVDYVATIASSADIPHARRVLMGVLKSLTDAGIGVIDDPLNTVTLTEITPNQLWTIHLWSKTPRAAAVREQLLIELRRAIDQEKLAPTPLVQHFKQLN